MTITTTPTKTNRTPRIITLAKAESLQFFRNKSLLVLLFFPMLVSLFNVLLTNGSFPGVSDAAEAFVLYSLTLLVYYPVLSMATARREEKVLKRLRTGEARDWEILGAFCVPLGLFTMVTMLLLMIIIAFLSDAEVPTVVNPVILILVIVMGTVFSNALALITSRFTPNAEGAALTWFPVLILLVVSLQQVRSIIPDTYSSIIEWTPFALCGDLFRLGWVGTVWAADSTEIGSFASTMVDSLPKLAALAAWTVVLSWLGPRYMRWGTYR